MRRLCSERQHVDGMTQWGGRCDHFNVRPTHIPSPIAAVYGSFASRGQTSVPAATLARRISVIRSYLQSVRKKAYSAVDSMT